MIGNPPLAALVLAAGAGVRFGGNQLAAHFRGEPLIVHAVRAARAAIDFGPGDVAGLCGVLRAAGLLERDLPLRSDRLQRTGQTL